MKLLVYGTLKRGYGNNHYLNGAEYLGERTVSGLKLYYSSYYKGGHGFPVASYVYYDEEKDRNKESIKGELYEIDESHLKGTDRLEGVPYMYTRETVWVNDGYGIDEECFVYVGNPEDWNFSEMTPCPRDTDGNYYWSRG